MTRLYNFSAGPSSIPGPVLSRARDELLDWHGCGLSVLEMSHRGKEFHSIAEKIESDLRALLGVPDTHRILFLQGGATTQFSLIPMNLSGKGRTASYVDTGYWSRRAIQEGRKLCDVQIAASSENLNDYSLPSSENWVINVSADYLHYTANETIEGMEFSGVPDSNGVPLVCDMSSNILSGPIDVERYALIYAGAQKNLGAAGITLVLIREDMLGRVSGELPSVFSYLEYAENRSLVNTPPTFIWYLMGLVIEWIDEQGGLDAVAATNTAKATKLYQAIDRSEFYSNKVKVDARSRMNIPFVLADADLSDYFILEAEKNGLVNLRGHRSVGGMRASLYNAMPESGVDCLVSFMNEFERRNG